MKRDVDLIRSMKYDTPFLAYRLTPWDQEQLKQSGDNSESIQKATQSTVRDRRLASCKLLWTRET